MSNQSLRQISQAGLQLIINSEGFEPLPKPCPAGNPTVGYGHVVRSGESFDHALSEDQALALLRRDLEGAQGAVQRLVRVPLDEGQFTALVSFAFNVGQTALAGSTLLRKLNAGDYTGAADEFPRWDKITVKEEGTGQESKKALPGLTTRRRVERKLFLASLGEGGAVA